MNQSLLEEFTTAVGEERYKIEAPAATYPELIKQIASREIASYFLDGTIQCRVGPRRSLIDICRIVLHHFPEVTVEEVVEYVSKELKDNNLRSFYCPDIKRQVIMYNKALYSQGFIYVAEEDESRLGYNSATRQLLESYEQAA